MGNWIVITKVDSNTDPSTWSYTNGTTFISSTLIEEQGE